MHSVKGRIQVIPFRMDAIITRTDGTLQHVKGLVVKTTKIEAALMQLQGWTSKHKFSFPCEVHECLMKLSQLAMRKVTVTVKKKLNRSSQVQRTTKKKFETLRKWRREIKQEPLPYW